MSGNQQIDPPTGEAVFPIVGDYELVPAPGEEGYIDTEQETETSGEEARIEETESLDDLDGFDDLDDDDEDAA